MKRDEGVEGELAMQICQPAKNSTKAITTPAKMSVMGAAAARSRTAFSKVLSRAASRASTRSTLCASRP